MYLGSCRKEGRKVMIPHVHDDERQRGEHNILGKITHRQAERFQYPERIALTAQPHATTTYLQDSHECRERDCSKIGREEKKRKKGAASR
jgi:hypothetical protein